MTVSEERPCPHLIAVMKKDQKIKRQQEYLNSLHTHSELPMPQPPPGLLKDQFKWDDIKEREPIHLELNNTARGQFRRQFPIPAALRPQIKEQILNSYNRGLLEKAPPGPYSAAMFPKLEEDKLRLIFDYSPLNDELRNREGPLPYLPELLQRAAKGRWFSVLDLASGFHQFPLTPDCRGLTAFSFDGMRYQWKVLPFGIKMAPSEAHHRLQSILQDLVDRGVVLVYIDDILVTTETREEHAKVLSEVYERLAKAGFYVKSTKLQLGLRQVAFLGHTIGHNLIGPKMSKVVSLKSVPPPTTRKKAQSWCGAVEWLAKFIKDVRVTMAPVRDCTRLNQKFKWTPEAQAAYDKINAQLDDLPALTVADVTKPFRLFVDASLVGCGAILVQDHGVLGYFSKAWKPAAVKWSAREREMRGVLEALRHFKLILLGRQVNVYCDHESLSQPLGSRVKTQHRKMASWIDELLHYGVKVIYTRGKNQGGADYMSRDVAQHCDLLKHERH